MNERKFMFATALLSLCIIASCMMYMGATIIDTLEFCLYWIAIFCFGLLIFMIDKKGGGGGEH